MIMYFNVLLDMYDHSVSKYALKLSKANLLGLVVGIEESTAK